jgi:hypothetical protein
MLPTARRVCADSLTAAVCWLLIAEPSLAARSPLSAPA